MHSSSGTHVSFVPQPIVCCCGKSLFLKLSWFIPPITSPRAVPATRKLVQNFHYDSYTMAEYLQNYTVFDSNVGELRQCHKHRRLLLPRIKEPEANMSLLANIQMMSFRIRIITYCNSFS